MSTKHLDIGCGANSRNKKIKLYYKVNKKHALYNFV